MDLKQLKSLVMIVDSDLVISPHQNNCEWFRLHISTTHSLEDEIGDKRVWPKRLVFS